MDDKAIVLVCADALQQPFNLVSATAIFLAHQVWREFLMSFYGRSLPTREGALPIPLYSPGRIDVCSIRLSVRSTLSDRATHKKCGFCQSLETAMSPSNADV